MKILFETQKVKFEGELNDTTAAQSVAAKLPFDLKLNTWGDELYFKVPAQCPAENATLDVAVGDIAFWHEGGCLCVFYGRTPISPDNKPCPASEVTVIGKVSGDISPLKRIRSGERITVKKID
ncbi:MAG TPA: cyclophilin-like fold protein [bacterium]|nr:cyclophilin-like fold protein [bacterium]